MVKSKVYSIGITKPHFTSYIYTQQSYASQHHSFTAILAYANILIKTQTSSFHILGLEPLQITTKISTTTKYSTTKYSAELNK